MLRLSFLVLASAFAFTSHVQALEASAANKKSIESGLMQNAETANAFTELEYQLVEASGLLSLSQQIKNSAQRLIAGSIEKPAAVSINHAQHFAIAKSLAKRWTEEEWQQRLLVLIHDMPVATQRSIQQQLLHPMIKAAQRKERAAISVQSDPAYQLYMNKLRQRPPAASRWKLVENLDKQSGFSQIIIQARSVVINDIQQQVKGWQPEGAWEKQARQDVLEFLFYAYRKTPNTELKQIADSFKQPELSQFYKDVLNRVK
ncbi:MAG: hypothetical protein KBT75_03020 [Oleispira antarctica]|nr:hypothetical protein [Oleispira antarctica]MBQ0794176.1 hypothetical protein [Oleispira antarctica]